MLAFTCSTSCVIALLFVHLPGDPQGLADHQQHRHHEGRGQGVLVRPHRRVPVLVQRRRGEALISHTMTQIHRLNAPGYKDVEHYFSLIQGFILL